MKVFFPLCLDIFGETASAKRMLCMARAMKSANVDTEIILYRQYSYGEGNKTGLIMGVPYHYIGFLSSAKYGPLFRKSVGFVNEVIFLFFLLLSLHRNDVVIYSGEKFIWDYLVLRIAHLKGAKYVEELCEYPYGRGVENHNTKKCRARKEKILFPKFDGVIPISEALEKYAEKYTSRNCKILKIPILVDFEKYNLVDKSTEASIPYIFHSGTLYEQKDGILGMIEAFGKSVDKSFNPILFISTGNMNKSPHAKAIEKLIVKYNLKGKIIFTGFLTDEDLRSFLQKATIVIINKAENQQNTYCFSTKLGEYMAAGKAVIITRVGEAMNWLTDGVDAKIVPPMDNEALSGAICELFNDSNYCTMIGNNARETCRRNFDYKVWGEKLSNFCFFK